MAKKLKHPARRYPFLRIMAKFCVVLACFLFLYFVFSLTITILDLAYSGDWSEMTKTREIEVLNVFTSRIISFAVPLWCEQLIILFVLALGGLSYLGIRDFIYALLRIEEDGRLIVEESGLMRRQTLKRDNTK